MRLSSTACATGHDRRHVLACLMGGALSSALVSPLRAWGCTAVDVEQASEDVLIHPVKVPQDFLGMHAHRWPGKIVGTSAPTYGFGAARSHDHDGVSWNQVHLAPGQYRWEDLDRWVAAHSAAKRTLIYTLYGTPAWLADRTDRLDLYGRPGGAAPPRLLPPLADFVKALVARYNAHGRRQIAFLETWNEPRFGGDSQDFWWGTAEQLVAVGRTVYTAARSVDSGVRVLSPGFAGDLAGALSLRLPALNAARRSAVFQYLTASDGHGGTGARWCDGIAFHSYNAPLSGEDMGYTRNIARLQKMLNMMQITLPLFNTECGFIAPHAFRNLAPAEQGVQLKRLAVLQAALGVQGLYLYSHDDDLIGNPSAHPEVASALDELDRHIAGATLQQVTLRADGAVHVVTGAGAFLW